VSASTTIGSPSMEITTVGITGGRTRVSPTGARTIPWPIKRRPSSVVASAQSHENWSGGQHPPGALQSRDGEPTLHPSPTSPYRQRTSCPPPLLDGGQGKINSMAGGDGGERATDDGLQWTVADDGDRVDNVWTQRDDMTAISDSFDPTDASCKLNSVDLPRSETSPTHSSVVSHSGDSTVNGVHPPPERSSARARKGVLW